MSSPSHVARLTQQYNQRISTSSPPLSPASSSKRKSSPSHGLRLSVVTSSDIQDGTGSVSSDNSNVTSNTDCDISSTTSSHHVPTHILSASSSASNHTFLEAESVEDGTPFVSIDLPFDPFAQSAETMMKVALEVFALSGVMNRYRIPVDRLTRFLEQVRDTYHAKNPYHNWQHAVHVLVNSFRFIQERLHLLDPLHVFGLLVSAVCHDADHSGLTNRHHAQEHGASNIGSPVGLTPYFGSGRKLPPRSPMGTNPNGILRRTGSASISISSDQKTPSLIADDYLHYLEKNSIRRACEILEHDEYDILAALNEDDREMIYDIMEDLILCTDVSDPAMVKDCRERWLSHQEICDLRVPLATAPADVVRTFNRDLSMMILLCADIGVVIEPFPIYISCVRALFYETRVHSNCLPNEYCKRQIGFLNGYGRELYETFARVGPLVPACNAVDRLISNRSQFEKELATRHGAYRLMGYGEPETREEDETEEATSSARNSVAQPNSPGLSRATEGLRLSDASAPIPPLPVNRPSITAQNDLSSSSSPRILTITTAATGSLNASMSPEADPGTGSNLAKRRYMRHTITVPLNNTGS